MFVYVCFLLLCTSSISGSLLLLPHLTLVLAHVAWSSLPLLAFLLFLVYVGGLLILIAYLMIFVSFSYPPLSMVFILPLWYGLLTLFPNHNGMS